MKGMITKVGLLGIVLGLAGLPASAGAAEGPEPIAYTVRFPSPEKHIAEVEAVVPTEGRPAVELMMAVWSPGFYRVEDYARKLEGLSARTPDGMALEVEVTRKNRWRIANKGGADEGRRLLPSHLRSPVGHDELGGPRPDRPERRGRVRHGRRGRRPPPPARGPSRAPARLPAVGDRDGGGPRRPPGPLPGPRL